MIRELDDVGTVVLAHPGGGGEIAHARELMRAA